MNIRKYRGNIPDRVSLHSNDLNVAAYIIYVNDLGLACYDESGLRPINFEKLEDLYIKGLLISDGGRLYTPTSLVTAEEVTTISYVKYDALNEEFVNSSMSSSEEVLPTLISMSVGGKTLTPTFSAEVLSYSMSTDADSDILVLDVFPEDTEIIVELGDDVITDYSEGITWTLGENTLTVTIGTDDPVVYTVTVTAS